MIYNRETLLRMAPIRNMESCKVSHGGVTHGLGEAGYDICIKQRIVFAELCDRRIITVTEDSASQTQNKLGRFTLASSREEFNMPRNLVGIVHDKSSWARQGLSVFNTVIEPGWCGFLTLELVYHGEGTLVIPAGAGIAQVVFHHTTDTAEYSGRYQHQANRPIGAITAD